MILFFFFPDECCDLTLHELNCLVMASLWLVVQPFFLVYRLVLPFKHVLENCLYKVMGCISLHMYTYS